MPVRLACGNQLVAHAHRKWQIGKAAAVQGSQFTPADAKFHAAEAMWRDRHARPCRAFTNDALVDALVHRTFRQPGPAKAGHYVLLDAAFCRGDEGSRVSVARGRRSQSLTSCPALARPVASLKQ